MRPARAYFLFAVVAAGVGDCTPPAPIDVGGLLSAPAQCAPSEFVDDTRFDIDLRAARIHGLFTIDGRELPPASPHGSLGFRERRTGAQGRFDLTGTTGVFGLTLPPGRYDVTYEPPTEACPAGGSTTLPCGTTSVATDVDLTSLSDLRRDLAIRTVRVSGTVRMLGSPVSPAGSQISFESATVAAPRAAVIGVGPNRMYDVRLGADVYRIGWIPSQVQCADSTDPDAPCTAGSLGRSIEVQNDAVVDVDVPSPRIQLKYRVNGRTVAPRDSSYALRFDDANGPVFRTDPTTTPTFSRRVLAGTYRVFVEAFTSCDAPTDNPWPCGTTALPERLVVTADATNTIDIRSVRVRGHLLFDGAMFPQVSVLDRGGLLFRDVARRDEALRPNEDTSIARVNFGSSGGPTAFDLWVQPGHYDVFYVSSLACDPMGGIPCGTSIVAQDVTLEADTMRDFDVRPVPLTVSLTRNGQMLPEASDRGSLRLQPIDTHVQNEFHFPTMGPARVTVRVGRGRYNVDYVGAAGGCESIACGTTRLRTELPVDAATEVSMELPRAFVRGRITVNMQPFEIPTGAPVSLAAFGADTGVIQVIPVQNGSFGTPSLGAGRYYTVFAAAACDRSTPEDLLCASEVVECP